MEKIGGTHLPPPIGLGEHGRQDAGIGADRGMEPEFPPTIPGLHPGWRLVLPGGRDVRAGETPADDHAPSQDASRGASASRAGRDTPPGVQMQASLALSAEQMAAKRAAEVPDTGGSLKRRMFEGLAYALGGTTEGSGQLAIMSGDDGGGPDITSETSLVPYSGGERSTALFAQQRPGEFLHAGVARVKEQLASIHGETAVQDDARRVVTLYHEMIFKPSIGNNLNFGVEREMKTLAVALYSLLGGSLGRTGDLLIARYTALGESVRSGHWDVAAELEALPV